jgi:hypothetical protein
MKEAFESIVRIAGKYAAEMSHDEEREATVAGIERV